VVAAGNDKVDACLESPSSSALAMTVGSVSPGDQMSTYSNYGPCVDIYAPGDAIQSAWFSSDNAYASMSGTSMAAPHVSGVKALLLTKETMNPKNLDVYLKNLASNGEIKGLGNDTPNLLLYYPPPSSRISKAKEGEDEVLYESYDVSH